MDIVEFIKKSNRELSSNPKFSSEEVYSERQLTKSYIRLGALEWFGVGYNLADANQCAIDKACKYFKWI